MDLIQLLIAALYGLVEGISEWLPISSTGHMMLLREFVALDVSEDFWNMFLVVIQLGAILAVCILFFRQLNPFSGKKTSQERSNTWKLWGKIILACIPASVIGIPLDDWMEEHLGGPFVVAAALIAYGIIFIIIETIREKSARTIAQTQQGRHFAQTSGVEKSAAEIVDENASVTEIDDLGWGRALGIGIFQVLSLVPGTSRSGSTIIGGLLLGCSRPVAAEFTFYLAIPVMVGASGLRLVKYFLKGNAIVMSELQLLLVGCAVAFVVSLLAIRFLMSFVRKHSFKPFGWYRIILGIAVLGWFGRTLLNLG
ncbi:MAG: undecaprenyl-diphosphate phosphatase [Atopobiaceae bacterium]|nr:undecaprenyl-diphosphate phosphatase [Atopobiaceae bacterium]